MRSMGRFPFPMPFGWFKVALADDVPEGEILTPDLVAALNTGPTALPADDNVLAAVRALGATGGLTVTARTAAPEETLA